MSNGEDSKLSLLRKEPRYCLFEELSPSVYQLLSEIKREGFTEKRRMLGNKFNKLLFSKKSDDYIMILSELFSDSIVYVTGINQETGINEGTIYKILEELRRFQVLEKRNVSSIPGVEAGLQNRLVLYHLTGINAEMLVQYVKNHWPGMIKDKLPEQDVSQYKLPDTKSKFCPKCKHTFTNGEEECNLCKTRDYPRLQQNGESKFCPACQTDYGKTNANFCNNEECVRVIPVKLVAPEVC